MGFHQKFGVYINEQEIERIGFKHMKKTRKINVC
ncbi:hypothetical protein J2Z34_002745 [Youngiibacter multivorans]|uniref:Uncharacterized protein n=1 Tax=Youngiibacter multivorans TaxID=937251 RepID=A0ABS4G6T0_9CLOT|nr:hypothetical protein [Youngiibacter multivorans]